MRHRLVLSCPTLIAVLAAPLWAQQLNPAHLPADTQWLIYVDSRAAASSLVYQQFITLLPQDRLDQAKRSCITKYGFDPVADVGAMYLFGPNAADLTVENPERPPHSTFIAHVRVDQKKMLAAMTQAAGKNYSTTRHHVHTIHHTGYMPKAMTEAALRLDAQGKARLDIQLDDELGMTAPYMVFYPGDLLVAGSQLEHLKTTLDVMDGLAPSMAQAGPGSILPIVSPGTYLVFAATSDVWNQLVGVDPNPAPAPDPGLPNTLDFRVKLGPRGAALMIGEFENQTFLATRFCVIDAQTAGHVKAAVEGLRAMFALSTVSGQSPQATAMQHLVRVLNTMEIAADQDDLRLAVRVPNEQLSMLIDLAKAELVKELQPASPATPPDSKPVGK
jgi:hypothetical protein